MAATGTAVSPGQKLTPNQNVLAVAGRGGDVWGANGGGSVAIGGGATDQTGYSKPIAAITCNGEMATNYIAPLQVPRTASILGRQNAVNNSGADLSGQASSSAIGVGGNNAG